MTAAQRSGLRLFLGSYPITTPASDILHELSAYKNFGVKTFQAEDEIAGVCSAIGAAFGGSLGLTTSSGPGIALKTEAMGLALMLELPLVVCNIQRGGPSTGLPTKTEQADLMQSLYGRNGESPIPVIACRTPGDCFETAYEAFRLAVKYMTPVIFLSDGHLRERLGALARPPGSGAPRDSGPLSHQPRRVPGLRPGRRHIGARLGTARNARARAPHRRAREGRAERQRLLRSRGITSVRWKTRAAKVAAIAQEIPPTAVHGPEKGDVLVLGWGSTYGSITQAVK